MIFLTVTVSLFAFCFISVCFGGIGRKIDIRERRLKSVDGISKAIFDEELEKSILERFIFPILHGVSTLLSRLVPKRKSGKDSGTLTRDLRIAGIRMTAQEYSLLRAATLCVLFILTFISMAFIPDVRLKMLVLLVGCVLSLLGPRYFLKYRISARQSAIQNQLPSVIDILSVSIEAGLGFDAALVRVLATFKGPLIDEFNQLYTELQMGRPRREALKSLGERSSLPELKSFASSVTQSDQLGIPIKNVLRTQASQLRASRKQRAEEKGMKAPVKMMLPMVGFVFPVIFIILLGPTILKLMEQFG